MKSYIYFFPLASADYSEFKYMNDVELWIFVFILEREKHKDSAFFVVVVIAIAKQENNIQLIFLIV